MAIAIDTVGRLLGHSGLAFGSEPVLLNGRRVSLDDPLPSVEDIVTLRGFRYRAIAGGGNGRLQLVAAEDEEPARIKGAVRVHAGYHKCLTMYTQSVYQRACRPLTPFGTPFRHFYNRSDAFYRECDRHRIVSVSGHAVDLDRFDDIRVVRFVRDPRDLVVSGYFYHRRAPEHWTELVAPTDVDWMIVGGTVPEGVAAAGSFAGYLNCVPVEDGLLAEIEFRRAHFASMMAWPARDERVRLYRYEDILGNEEAVFCDVLRWLCLPWFARRLGARHARRFRASSHKGRSTHIRDPASGQWRELFTPRVRERFDAEYAGLVEKLGYSVA